MGHRILVIAVSFCVFGCSGFKSPAFSENGDAFEAEHAHFAALTQNEASPTLTIISALYGNNGSTRNCTSYVARTCNGQSECRYTGSNLNCGGDPDAGSVKVITVNYSCSNGATGTASATEGAVGNLSCSGAGPISSPAAVFGTFSLAAGQSLSIPNAQGVQNMKFLMQSDGNLVLYQGSTPLWAAGWSPSLDGQNVAGRNCQACVAIFQGDGNLVLYEGNGTAYWASNTGGDYGARLGIAQSSPYIEILFNGSPVSSPATVISPKAPASSQAAAPAPTTRAPASTAVTLVWVDKADGSLAQFPGGFEDLQSAANALGAAGVQVYAQQKTLRTDLSVAFPVTNQGLSSSNSNPSPALASGVQNSFEISENDLGAAQAQGYALRSGQVLSAQGCGGSNVLLAFGQSNSANAGWQADTSSVANLLMFYNGYCFPARDPLLGASVYNNGGSLWMPFAKAYLADHPGQKVVLVSFGVSGSQSADWAQNGLWNSRLNTVLNQVENAGLSITRVFWHQGETDTLNGVSQAQYSANLNSVYSTVRQYTSAPISLAVASYVGSLPYRVSTAVQSAQLQFTMSHPNDVGIGVVSDLYTIAYRGPDDLHFNGVGLSSVANAWYHATLAPSAPSYAQQMVSAFYETYLQRIPTFSPSQAGYWLNFSTAAAFSGIAGSDEAFIRSQYIGSAHRLPDEGGLQYWTSEVASNGRSAMANFASDVQNVISSGSYDHNLWYVSNGMLFPFLNLWHVDLGLGAWVQN